MLLADPGITKSHLRPYVSNDNTMEYRPDFQERFDSIEGTEYFCQGFFHYKRKKHQRIKLEKLLLNGAKNELYLISYI